MDPNNKNLTPEEELDALLAKFLADPSDEIPTNVVTPQEQPPEEPSRLEEILVVPENIPEIGVDEVAVASAGLTRPEEAELEQIIRETKAEMPEPPVETQADGFLDSETRDAFDEGKTLDQIFSTDATLAPLPPIESEPEEAAAEPAPKEPVAPPQKRAPKKKNTYGLLGIPHILATVIWLLLAVTIGAAAGRILWLCASDVLAFGREDMSVTISITKDDNIETITEKLHTTGLVEYPALFKIYAQLSNAEKKIAPGIYELNTLYDYHALVLMMSSTSNRVTVKVTIPEGYTCQQVFQLLQDKGICTIDEMEGASATGELGDYWFLEGLTRGDKYCLEGFLFPDTYEFYANDNPVRVLNKFLNNFDYRFNEDMVAKLEALNATLAAQMAANGLSQDYIDSHKMTIREVVIIASMIEKEAAAPSESYKIASVIYNRLCNPVNFPYLNIDAALVYVTGKPQLTEEDKQLDSPYNTYLYQGLIPGAISNPGRPSLNAALDPESTDYYYYALDPAENRHHFSKTYDEHQAFLDSLQKEDENG